MMDAATIRQSFPILFQEVNDEPLVYLDNAATTQKPTAVLDVLRHSMKPIMPMFIVGCTR